MTIGRKICIIFQWIVKVAVNTSLTNTTNHITTSFNVIPMNSTKISLHINEWIWQWRIFIVWYTRSRSITLDKLWKSHSWTTFWDTYVIYLNIVLKCDKFLGGRPCFPFTWVLSFSDTFAHCSCYSFNRYCTTRLQLTILRTWTFPVRSSDFSLNLFEKTRIRRYLVIKTFLRTWNKTAFLWYLDISIAKKMLSWKSYSHCHFCHLQSVPLLTLRSHC